MKETIKRLQESGIPLFFIRDQGKPSVTLTLVVLSSTFVMFGLLNGVAKFVKGVDMDSALTWNMYCLSLYLGRKFSKKDGIGEKTDVKES